MLAEPAGQEFIDPPGGGGVAAAAVAWPRPGTLDSSRFRRRRGDGRDRPAMLGYLQHVAVLYPGQVLACVVAQLANSDSHIPMLPHVLPQEIRIRPSLPAVWGLSC